MEIGGTLWFVGFLILIVIGSIAGYINYNYRTAEPPSMEELAGDELERCQELKQDYCQNRLTPRNTSYPEYCFEEGQNVLSEPYTCPN